MKRIELYVDKNDRLTVAIFNNVSDEYETTLLSGQECYQFLSQLRDLQITKIEENEINEEVSLCYKNCVVNISEYEKVLSKRGTSPIKVGIDNYYKSEALKEIKPKKVRRKNKFSGKVVIATGLALITIIGVASKMSSNNKNNNIAKGISPSSSTSYFVDETERDYMDISYNQKENVQNEDMKVLSNTPSVDVSINYEDRSDEDKGIITEAYYGEAIEKYSKIYGVNPNIMTAIATQERGIHSTTMDEGGATGLMQVQNAVFSNQELSAYNYETKQTETIIVDEQRLSDVFYNIKVGCMVFQNAMGYMNNNVLAAIQCYNMGYGNMMTILNNYSNETGKTIEQILSDATDKGWLKYRNQINEGDRLYIEHVLSWIGSNITLENIEHDNSLVTLNISNNEETIKKR